MSESVGERPAPPRARGRSPCSGTRRWAFGSPDGQQSTGPTAKAIASIVTEMVRKAVIPAAGLGTRFLPATKASRRRCCRSSTSRPSSTSSRRPCGPGSMTSSSSRDASERIEDHFDRASSSSSCLEKASREADVANRSGDRRAREHPLRPSGRAHGPRPRVSGARRARRRRAVRGPPRRRPHGGESGCSTG